MNLEWRKKARFSKLIRRSTVYIEGIIPKVGISFKYFHWDLCRLFPIQKILIPIWESFGMLCLQIQLDR